jgi:hypothetical protein
MHNPYFREMEIRYRLEEAHRVAAQLGQASLAPAQRGWPFPRGMDPRLPLAALVRTVALLLPTAGR